MIKRNANRGAGLVTVVAVLAIASILLAWTIFLSFNHYGNAIQAEENQQHLAEVELCADLIHNALNQGTSIDKLLPEANKKNLLRDFYGVGKTEFADGVYRFDGVSVTVEKPEGETYIITISKGNASKYYSWDASVWQEVSP